MPARAPVKPSAPPQKPLIGRAPSLLDKKQKTRTSAGGDDAQTNIASVKPIGIRGVGAATSGNKLCAHVNTGRGKLNDREPRKGKVDADVSGIAPRFVRQTCQKAARKTRPPPEAYRISLYNRPHGPPPGCSALSCVNFCVNFRVNVNISGGIIPITAFRYSRI